LESTYIIVIGLVLDVIGVILIINPWMYAKSWTPKRVRDEFVEGISENPEAEKRNKQRKLMIIGFSLLIFGFLFQIVGNLM